MKVTLDMVVFNYLDRPIFDIYVDGKGGDISMGYPSTGGSTMSGIEFQLGPKKVTWVLDGPEGTPRNGEKVTARNNVSLSDVPSDAQYLAVYIYPDETVELQTTKHYPRASARAKMEIEKLEKKRGE